MKIKKKKIKELAIKSEKINDIIQCDTKNSLLLFRYVKYQF